jgi:hypothetical protein
MPITRWTRQTGRRESTPNVIFHDLSLLLHSVIAERLSRLEVIAVGAGADSELPMQQVAQLVHRSPAEVPGWSPRLILATVSQFVRQDRQIVLAVAREEYVVAQSHRAVTAQEEHRSSKRC